jgi:mannose-6-phosphate isomerase-like protein (cupin superfamily)
MHVFDVSKASPIVTAHGETIYEILGWAVGNRSENHSVAHVVIAPGESSLRHFHPQAQESYYILHGRAKIEVGTESSLMTQNQIVLIPPPQPHKIYNLGQEDLVFLAICVPAWEPSNTVWLETD